MLSNSILTSQKIYQFNTISTDDNLSSQLGCYHFYQSPKGLVWISSFYGLNCYDGSQIKNYLPVEGDTTSLAGPEVLGKIVAARGEDFFVSTIEAIHKYNFKQDNFQRLSIKNGYDKGTDLLHFDTINNQLWGINNNTIILIEVENENQVIELDTVKNFYGRGMTLINMPNNEKCLLIPHRNSFEIRHYTPNNKNKQFRREVAVDETPITCFFYENKNIIWVGTQNKGVFKYNVKNNNLVSFKKQTDHLVGEITSIFPRQNGKLVWTTKENGVFIFDKKKEVIIDQLSYRVGSFTEPFSEVIEAAYLDNQQNIWLYSPSNGILYTSLIKSKFTTFLDKKRKTGHLKSYVVGMVHDTSGTLWALSKDGLFYSTEDKNNVIRFNKFNTYDKKVNLGKPFFLFCDKQNRKWIICNQGIYCLEEGQKKIKKINSKYNDSSPPFNSMYQLPNGKIILNSYFQGAFELVESAKNIYVVPYSPLPHNKSYGFTYVSKKLLINYAYEGIGIFSYTQDSIQQDTFIKTNEFVVGMTTFDSTTYWIATTSGLYRLEQKKQNYQLNRIPFSYGNLKGLIGDNLNNLWITSGNKILRYNTQTKDIRIFKPADGVQPKEFNDWAAIRWKDNQLVFGGHNGLNIINSTKKYHPISMSSPYINQILVNDELPAKKLECSLYHNKNSYTIKQLNFPYQNNTLSFRFAALDYTDPDANEFKYRITPTETEWVYSGTENFARYANLAPGDYTFEVDATNSDGIWSNNPAQLDITILPPWYQTWWFRTLVTIGITGVVYLIYRNRVQQIQKEADFKRKEAEYKQLAAETETAVLRLQMNPHFIFNSMNSISSYLLQKDIETANDYLGRFARLMRKILIVAEQPYLSLYDEIELLEQYMQAEAMRFEEQFQYEFIVDKTIDTDDILIPTMILQPFVENAIWHGITNKKEQGKIEIEFTIQQEKLICRVTDNGIGRKAAGQNATSQHESKAISITQRRLDLLTIEHSLSFQPSLSIQDLVDPQDQPEGTTVILTLPLI